MNLGRTPDGWAVGNHKWLKGTISSQLLLVLWDQTDQHSTNLSWGDWGVGDGGGEDGGCNKKSLIFGCVGFHTRRKNSFFVGGGRGKKGGRSLPVCQKNASLYENCRMVFKKIGPDKDGRCWHFLRIFVTIKVRRGIFDTLIPLVN